MRLGSQTGSVINNLLARGTIGQPDAKVGMGVTILMWTDRRPATIFRVFEFRGCLAIEARDDDYSVTAGSTFDGSAEYAFKVNLRGRRNYFVFKDGIWREAYYPQVGYTDDGQRIYGEKLKLAKKGAGNGLRIGERRRYEDPSF